MTVSQAATKAVRNSCLRTEQINSVISARSQNIKRNEKADLLAKEDLGCKFFESKPACKIVYRSIKSTIKE